MTTSLYAIFHLNLAFSAIEEDERLLVINQCYWPLLKLAKTGIPIGIEATGFTLEIINKLDPKWIEEFTELLKYKKCELLASGDSQIIGPLVPAKVNEMNLLLGMEFYRSVLKYTPTIAYINEQALSAGLLDIYIKCGFEAIIVEYDNIYSNKNNSNKKFLDRPCYLKSLNGYSIKVLWNHTISFQKFQRYAHGEIDLDQYLTYLNNSINEQTISFPIYGSDAEVFNFRPKRYKQEKIRSFLEWDRLNNLLTSISKRTNYNISLPSDVTKLSAFSEIINPTSANHPIVVKKQPKYNISRWAVSGRNDLLMNSICFNYYEKIKNTPKSKTSTWKKMCRMWASDFRTHITEKRYQGFDFQGYSHSTPTFLKNRAQITENTNIQADGHYLKIDTKNIKMVLNRYRGLSIQSLAFSAHKFKPIIGTIPHGYFNDINYSVDYYSNHLVAQLLDSHQKEADLNEVTHEIYKQDDELYVSCSQYLEIGTVIKWYKIAQNRVETGFHFKERLRPFGSLRLGFLTLLDVDTRPWYRTKLGGYDYEHFQIEKDMDQGAPVSPIVSSSGILGSTDGRIYFGNNDKALKISWKPSLCASLPMISSLEVSKDQFLSRLCFSLVESDETLKRGGEIPDFSCSIAPSEIPT